LSLWEVIEIMYEDLKKFIEIKISQSKKMSASSGPKKTLMNGGFDTSGGVDIARNFNVRDCFGT
jgi:hypothetical protein